MKGPGCAGTRPRRRRPEPPGTGVRAAAISPVERTAASRSPLFHDASGATLATITLARANGVFGRRPAESHVTGAPAPPGHRAAEPFLSSTRRSEPRAAARDRPIVEPGQRQTSNAGWRRACRERTGNHRHHRDRPGPCARPGQRGAGRIRRNRGRGAARSGVPGIPAPGTRQVSVLVHPAGTGPPRGAGRPCIRRPIFVNCRSMIR